MRDDLETMLHDRWPPLFRGRSAPPGTSCMAYGCAIGDGWFGLLDALCETLAARAAERGLDTAFEQVKEKFGALRAYAGGVDEHGVGAVLFAEAASVRICEVSGAPGRTRDLDGWYRTVSDEVAERGGHGRWTEPDREDADGALPGGALPVGASVGDLRAKWGGHAGGIDLPPGWVDLGDALLRALLLEYRHPDGWGRSGVVVRSLARRDGRLAVEADGLDERRRGMVAVAVALAARTDPETGWTEVPPPPAG